MRTASPGVLTLCHETLYHIFLLTFNAATRRSIVPWQLAALCKRWRAVAHAAPQLWTRFDICRDHECKTVHGVCVSNLPDMVRCCLQLRLVQSLPIDVVYIPMERNHAQPHSYEHCAKHSHRWRTLRFAPSTSGSISRSPWEFSRTCNDTPIMFSALTRIDYICEEGLFLLEPHFHKESLPALTTLRLHNWEGDLATDFTLDTASCSPWGPLRYIILVDFTGDSIAILRLLKACPVITHFSLSSAETTSNTTIVIAQDRTTVVLEELVQLQIELERHSEPASLLQIVSFISCPKLKRLPVHHCGILEHPREEDYLRALVARSGCKARFLDVTKS